MYHEQSPTSGSNRSIKRGYASLRTLSGERLLWHLNELVGEHSFSRLRSEQLLARLSRLDSCRATKIKRDPEPEPKLELKLKVDLSRAKST